MNGMEKIKKIKKSGKIRGGALALAAWILAGCAASPQTASKAEEPRGETFSFYLINDTWMWDFYEVRIAAPESADWGPNVLDAPLPAGGKALLSVSASFEGVPVNLIVYTEDGYGRVLYNAEAREGGVITVDEESLADF
ncbi:MAG: hypothetical protein LBD24_01420 [Spirochaetaceae bacterium]|jgi:hypothetical protein|nr:hypothetical protein [Spirochaetaceae bacterium]